MEINEDTSIEALLEEIGRRIAHRRIFLGLSQATVAEEAGVGKRTVERLEAGASTQLSTFLRILRTLGLVQRVDGLVPEARATPMELLEHEGKRRQRAPRKSREDAPDWTWGDNT